MPCSIRIFSNISSRKRICQHYCCQGISASPRQPASIRKHNYTSSSVVLTMTGQVYLAMSLLAISNVNSFQLPLRSPDALVRYKPAVCRMAEDDENLPLPPRTSFGSEAVPESQRPVNEFLDVTSQPMFGWASLETGSKGLLTRLVTVYSVLFATV